MRGDQIATMWFVSRLTRKRWNRIYWQQINYYYYHSTLLRWLKTITLYENLSLHVRVREVFEAPTYFLSSVGSLYCVSAYDRCLVTGPALLDDTMANSNKWAEYYQLQWLSSYKIIANPKGEAFGDFA